MIIITNIFKFPKAHVNLVEQKFHGFIAGNGLVAFKLGKIGARNPISANLLLGDFLCFSNHLVNCANILTHRRLLVLNMKCENSGHFVNAFSSYYIIRINKDKEMKIYKKI